MYVYLSKILPLFVMPLGVAMMLCLLALILLRLKKRKTAGIVIALTFMVLWISSIPATANLLYRHLESGYPAKPLSEIPEADCIVLLGGVVGAPVAPRVDLDMNDSVDRVYKAAQLHRAGKGKFLIVSAGNQPWSQSPWDEADVVRELLMEWGVPEESIMLEGSSRNTRENAQFSKNIIDAINCDTTLLVTSAAHMPRAMAAFRDVGASVFPVSTDVKSTNDSAVSPVAFLPSAGALSMTSTAIREWIGRKVYEFKGWG